MEEPRGSVILDNTCEGILSFKVNQCLEGQILHAEDAECCQF